MPRREKASRYKVCYGRGATNVYRARKVALKERENSVGGTGEILEGKRV